MNKYIITPPDLQVIALISLSSVTHLSSLTMMSQKNESIDIFFTPAGIEEDEQKRDEDTQHTGHKYSKVSQSHHTNLDTLVMEIYRATSGSMQHSYTNNSTRVKSKPNDMS